MTHSARPRVVAIIPARFASVRFPGKMLAPLLGKPLVWHTRERARQATLVDEVLVATDDARVAEALAPLGAKVVMTGAGHQTGTDRIAEVAAGLKAEIIVNVQGDEPLIDPRCIDAAIRPLLEDPELVLSTARRPLEDATQIADPNVVKVVCGQRGRALYFTRCPVPYVRDAAPGAPAPGVYWQHIGLYVYRREFLLEFARLPQTPLEQYEKLEQLRALEHGYPIAVVDTEYEAAGVDVPSDLDRVEARMRALRQEW